MRSVGLFAGVGGLELGLARAGIGTESLCEDWEPAASTLRRHFDTPVVGDIRRLSALPKVDVVTAGFPCTDLSQVGRTAGIGGDESGLIREVFRLIGATPPTWLVLENVPNLLMLHKGAPIRSITEWLDRHGWHWAYRTVDSQHFGVRQRRRRVFLVASPSQDPRQILFADETTSTVRSRVHSAYGFYWTEGNRGLGWGEGVIPTLKGGSQWGIPSPPGVWRRDAEVGQAIVRPSIEAGEALQGFRAGWTSHVSRHGDRWKLVGNAVTVPVAEWVGHRLREPGQVLDVPRREFDGGRSWPAAAACVGKRIEGWDLTEHPIRARGQASLSQVLERHGWEPLSHGATRGFATRLAQSRLRHDPLFMGALEQHIESVARA